MITINAAFGQEEKVLGTLGRIGENETRQIVFDCSDILTEYPGAEIVCVMQRHCDRIAYLADAVLDGNALIVTLTDADVSAPGDLRIELRALTDGKIRKSAVYMGQVVSSLRGEQDKPGNPTADVLNRIDMTISRAEESIADADAAAKSARDVADTVQAKLDNGEFVGPAGKDGADGAPGKDGKDGTPGPKGDTYDDREVRADISELKDEKVDKTTIFGGNIKAGITDIVEGAYIDSVGTVHTNINFVYGYIDIDNAQAPITVDISGITDSVIVNFADKNKKHVVNPSLNWAPAGIYTLNNIPFNAAYLCVSCRIDDADAVNVNSELALALIAEMEG